MDTCRFDPCHPDQSVYGSVKMTKECDHNLQYKTRNNSRFDGTNKFCWTTVWQECTKCSYKTAEMDTQEQKC